MMPYEMANGCIYSGLLVIAFILFFGLVRRR